MTDRLRGSAAVRIDEAPPKEVTRGVSWATTISWRKLARVTRSMGLAPARLGPWVLVLGWGFLR